MDSPWQVPLPQKEHISSRVVVYFYNGGWIPITFYPLIEAIRLHRMGLSSGMDIVVFSPNLDPRISEFTLSEADSPYSSTGKGYSGINTVSILSR